MYNQIETKRINPNKKDSLSKRLLTRKDVLSYILKYLVEEYKNIDIKDIKASLKSGKDDKHIKVLKSRDIINENSIIGYDILFTVEVPNTSEEIGMYINIEPQGIYDKSYKLIRRAIYYACRIISSQKGIDFKKQEFNNIKKVYSIWLVIDDKADKNKLGSINSYTINENNLCKKYKIDKKEYDLINIVFAYISSNDNYGQYQQLMKLLYMMFVDTKIEPDDKLNIIKDEYDNIDIDEELKDMCTYEEVIEYRAKNEGISLGKQEGYNLGVLDTTIDNVLNCMDYLNVSMNEAIKILKIKKNIKAKVIEEVKKKLN